MSYFEDHGIEDPLRAKRQQQHHASSAYPDLSNFMPSDHYSSSSARNSPQTSSTGGRNPQPRDFRELADLFGTFRHRQDARGLTDEGHDQMLDNLITQLMDEANAPGQHHGPPPASESFIRNLPVLKFRDLRGREAEDSCMICNDAFKDPPEPASAGEKILTRLPCKHLFDIDCITPWLKLHNTCPCRAEVPSDDPVWKKKKKDEELAKYAAEAEIDEDWMYS